MKEKELMLSAIKDMWLNDSYEEYSIGGGISVVRNDDVGDWRDEGFSVLLEDEADSTFSAELFAKDEEEWLFNKGKVLERMAESAAFEYEDVHTCSITDEEYEGYGNNAWPYSGRCSDFANSMYVIPARIAGVTDTMIDWCGGNEAFKKIWDEAEDSDELVRKVKTRLLQMAVE